MWRAPNLDPGEGSNKIARLNNATARGNWPRNVGAGPNLDPGEGSNKIARRSKTPGPGDPQPDPGEGSHQTNRLTTSSPPAILFPLILLVELDAVLLEERTKFLLERKPAVMLLLLRRHIPLHVRNPRRAD